MKTKNVLFFLSLCVLLVGCSKDEGTSNSTTTGINAKWEVTSSNSEFASFEFTESGNYIIVEKSSLRSSSGIHTGTYTSNGNTLNLLGFGVVVFQTDGEIVVLSVERTSASGEKVEYSLRKIKNTIEEAEQSNLLCKTWKLIRIAGLPTSPGNGELSILFSKAGSYLVTYTDGTPTELNQWKWYDKQKTIIQHSPDLNIYNGSIANIVTLTKDSLVLMDLGILEMVFVSTEKTTEQVSEKNFVKCLYVFDEVSYNLNLEKKEPSATYDPNNIEAQYEPYTKTYFSISNGKCEIVGTNILIMKELAININHDVEQGKTYDIYSTSSNITLNLSAGAGTGLFNISQLKDNNNKKIGEITITKKTNNRMDGSFWSEMNMGKVTDGKFSVMVK